MLQAQRLQFPAVGRADRVVEIDAAAPQLGLAHVILEEVLGLYVGPAAGPITLDPVHEVRHRVHHGVEARNEVLGILDELIGIGGLRHAVRQLEIDLVGQARAQRRPVVAVRRDRLGADQLVQRAHIRQVLERVRLHVRSFIDTLVVGDGRQPRADGPGSSRRRPARWVVRWES